ncbi:hypothetical protein C5F59_038900 [Streptomyces sp. QL37]|uniref:hypothetical protein n=1 Tax=Streptomyces sp. QL37 TaxID=2093747 RepID=UPI000CF2F833|nr:hypothetical protein [Streptomyces sp. QL37]PPQ62080.1 hypothetical protein C5F59_39665 [Streptomyces sp. QL37]
MGAARRLYRFLLSAVVGRLLFTETADEFGESDSEDMRIISRLYQILDRKTPYAAGLEHVVSSVVEHYSRPNLKLLTASILSSLVNETALQFDGMCRSEQAGECRRMASRWPVGNSERIMLRLRFAISNSHRLYELKPLTVDAIIRAILFEIDRVGPRVNRPTVLTEVAYAAFSTGNQIRLRTVNDKLTAVADSPGFWALTRYYESRLLVAAGQFAEVEALVAEFHETAAGVTKSDPAYAPTQFLLRHLTERSEITQDYAGNEAGAMGLAAEAMQRGDWRQAVELNEQAAEGESPGAMRSCLYGLAETARLESGMLETSSALDACLDRLAANNLFAARSLLPLEALLIHLFAKAVHIYELGDTAAPVARVSDMLGEFRGGSWRWACTRKIRVSE